jgi:hypothetical protein
VEKMLQDSGSEHEPGNPNDDLRFGFGDFRL